MINPFEQKVAEEHKPEPKPIKYDPNRQTRMSKFEMEAPGEYKMVNNHGTAVRRLPKIKGKAAKKQAKKFRRLVSSRLK